MGDFVGLIFKVVMDSLGGLIYVGIYRLYISYVGVFKVLGDRSSLK